MADIKAGNRRRRALQPARLLPKVSTCQSASKPCPWHEHIPFAKVLVQLLRPKRSFVKVGFADLANRIWRSCETAAALGVACYGVEANRVRHAGVADEQTVKALHAYHDAQFGNFSQLLTNSGTDAAAHFTQGTVDLLQIDDQHTYDAVCKDWETWRPKLSRSGVVLFHHTNVREGDYGVWKLWKELRPTYRNFEFLHGAGLGVLVAGQSAPGTVEQFVPDVGGEKSGAGAQIFFRTRKPSHTTLAERCRSRRHRRFASAAQSRRRHDRRTRRANRSNLEQAAEVERLEAKIEELSRTLRARVPKKRRNWRRCAFRG